MRPDEPDDLARLSPQARAPERRRGRLGVGAAIVLLIATLVTAVVISAFAQPAERPLHGAIGVPGPSGSATSGPASGSTSAEESEAAPSMFVHVLGAVNNPGLFEVSAGARVMDVVSQAGGLTASADQAAINLARLLADGEQLYVPAIGEAPPAAAPGPAAGTPAGPAGAPAPKVNLNTATSADLDTLPRVGPMMAQRILDYRTTNGPFVTIEDLRNVTGIGEKTFEALKDLVTT